MAGEITGQDQVQRIERSTALGSAEDFTGNVIDMDKYDSFGLSVFIERDSADTDVDVIIEHAFTSTGTFRQASLTNLAVTAGNPTATLDQIIGVTRQFIRIRLINKTANALLTTEAGIHQKPTS